MLATIGIKNKYLTLLLFTATAFLCITCFNILWIWMSPLTEIELADVAPWTCAITVALIVAFPCVVTQKRWPSFLLLVILSIILIANLMYEDNFGCQIPLYSYGIVFNLADFTESVINLLHPVYLVFPLLLFICYLLSRKIPPQKGKISVPYLCMVICGCLISRLFLSIPDGMAANYNKLNKSHRLVYLIPVKYTLAAKLVEQWRDGTRPITQADKDEVNCMINAHRELLHDHSNGRSYTNLVLIFMESLESDVIGRQVDGEFIAPRLTALMADSGAVFVKNVIPQVGAGRSMDAQLIVNCGLLPPNGSVYTFSYPGNCYPSIIQLFKEHTGAGSIDMTTDFPSTYNQGVMFKQLGFDRFLGRDDYRNKKLHHDTHPGDAVFFSESARKLSQELWPESSPMAVQLVSYTCHSPFRLPRDVRGKKFSDSIPTEVRKYYQVANYTDKALGEFIDYLRSRKDYDNTLVVITGDHEAFPDSQRQKYAEQHYLDKTAYIPFIVLNAPANESHRDEINQCDIYPTLLEMLGFTDAEWPGVGHSMFYTGSHSCGAMMVSNLIIKHDLLKNTRK